MAAAGCFDPTMEPGDLVLVTKGLRDEGTSHHYLPADAEAVPDPDLNQAFAGALTAAGLDYRSGVTLTTDAPNRITAREIQRMREDGVLTVEMEAAAVFAAGSALGRQTACAVVADSVADENMNWHLDAAAAGQIMLALFATTVDLLAEID